MGTIIFFSFILIVLSLMLMIDIGFNFDSSTMKANIIIKLYKIKIIKIDINLLTIQYRINNGKYKHLKILLQKEEKYFISQIKNNILNKLYYDSVSLETVLNLFDPKLTADVIGVLYILYNISNFWLLSKNEDIELCYSCRADFNKINNKIKFDLRVYFTVFDMLYAVILSFYRRGKYVKEK